MCDEKAERRAHDRNSEAKRGLGFFETEIDKMRKIWYYIHIRNRGQSKFIALFIFLK